MAIRTQHKAQTPDFTIRAYKDRVEINKFILTFDDSDLRLGHESDYEGMIYILDDLIQQMQELRIHIADRYNG